MIRDFEDLELYCFSNSNITKEVCMTGGNCVVCKLVTLLVIVGAINWGLVGAFHTDLVAKFLGDMTTASKVVYSVIGIAGLLKIVSLFKACPCCKK